MTEPVNLADYGDVLKRVIPEAELRTDSYGGVGISWGIRVNLEHARAVSAEHATELIAELAERVRLRAIRDLGLRPILDAQEAEVREYREANRHLNALAERRAARITELEERLRAIHQEASR